MSTAATRASARLSQDAPGTHWPVAMLRTMSAQEPDHIIALMASRVRAALLPTLGRDLARALREQASQEQAGAAAIETGCLSAAQRAGHAELVVRGPGVHAYLPLGAELGQGLRAALLTSWYLGLNQGAELCEALTADAQPDGTLAARTLRAVPDAQVWMPRCCGTFLVQVSDAQNAEHSSAQPFSRLILSTPERAAEVSADGRLRMQGGREATELHLSLNQWTLRGQQLRALEEQQRLLEAHISEASKQRRWQIDSAIARLDQP